MDTGQKKDTDLNKIINHWISTSEEDFETMKNLYNSKSYSWCLFLGHISTEKLLKALYVSVHNKHAPFTHNLLRLAELCKIKLDSEISDQLDTITSFNLNTRYDDYKREFYNKCTKAYTKDWFNKIESLRQWIKEML
jgi:HEPN domain-containing protein